MNLESPKFYPQQKVAVVHLGINYQGRITACILQRGGWSYEVEYQKEGDFLTRSFYADELEDRA
jgi:hypothetical protein